MNSKKGGKTHATDEETSAYFERYGLDNFLCKKLITQKNEGKILVCHRYGSSDIQSDVSGLVLGLASMVIALLGVAVLVTYSPQNGLILLLIAFLISPYGLPKLAFWMLGKVQGLKYTIQNFVYG